MYTHSFAWHTWFPQTQPDSKLRIPSMSKCNFYQLDSQYNVYAWSVQHLHTIICLNPHTHLIPSHPPHPPPRPSNPPPPNLRNTITVGIFYALPAFQLVISQQLVGRSNTERVTPGAWGIFVAVIPVVCSAFPPVTEDRREWGPVLLQFQVCCSVRGAQVKRRLRVRWEEGAQATRKEVT